MNELKEIIQEKLRDAIIMQEGEPSEYWRGKVNTLEDILEEIDERIESI